MAGCTRSSPSPTSAARATASGRRLSIASAPTSTTTPPTSACGGCRRSAARPPARRPPPREAPARADERRPAPRSPRPRRRRAGSQAGRAPRQRGTGRHGTDPASSASQPHEEEAWVLVAGPCSLLVAALAVVVTGSLHPRLRPDRDESSGDMAPRHCCRARGADDGRAQDDARARTPADVARPPAAAATAPMTRAVISTGQVTVHTQVDQPGPRGGDPAGLVVGRLVARRADHQRRPRPRRRVHAHPAGADGHFTEAMTAFADLGEVEQQSRKSEDVTTKVIDNDARVRAAERSIRQIEALLGRAEKLERHHRDRVRPRPPAGRPRLAEVAAGLPRPTRPRQSRSPSTSSRRARWHLRRRETHGLPGGLSQRLGRAAGRRRSWSSPLVGAVLPFAVLLLVLGVPLWLGRTPRGLRLRAGRSAAGVLLHEVREPGQLVGVGRRGSRRGRG